MQGGWGGGVVLFFTMRTAGFTQGPQLPLGQMSQGRAHHSASAFELADSPVSPLTQSRPDMTLLYQRGT